MNKNLVERARPMLAAALVAVTAITSFAVSASQAAADPFASPSFQRIWEQTDKAVASGQAARTWIWGDQPFKALQEKYVQGATGTRLVQYFDKSRMEINNPSGDPSSPWYVTNGLLVVEMMSGAFQIGDNQFEQSYPANIAVAGDTGDNTQSGPTYAAMSKVASLQPGGNTATAQPAGNAVVATIDRTGAVDQQPAASVGAAVQARYAVYIAETKHNIPDVFWSYLNVDLPASAQAGSSAQTNWLYVMGYPITEPYWTNIRVGGIERRVLVQAFQRRILTYSPDNPVGWKVEMGNVGRHYYSWRYERPVCQSVPVRGFGTVYTSAPDVARALGCPAAYQSEQATTTALETFQHGTMLYVNKYGSFGATIFVFFDDGTYQRFDDRYVEGAANSCSQTAPSGFVTPQRGFGKVWCEGTGARVQERLGWATNTEQGASGAWQQFERGFMIWTGATNQIFVLIDNASPSGDTHRYQVFADAFK